VRTQAKALARFLPDCAILFGRLLRDSRVSRADRLLLLAIVPYLALPFDLVPDFLPVVGQLDDALLVGWVLRRVVRGSGQGLIEEHWPGPEHSRTLILRLAGAPGQAG
jgi:uncharacterized membrane protein YkvA (DUF1232 family)